MAPSVATELVNNSDKTTPTQENKPPIPTGAGVKKAMEAYFTGNNHMEFRQRSSSASRSTRTFSRGATPSRDAVNGGASGSAEGAIDPDVLKNALKKIPSVEKIAIRPTPPRSRSISRCHSPLPDEELRDESLPEFYKVNLKPTERTGSQTRDILLGGNRLSRSATPSDDASVPEFHRVALRRTPSREQLADERVHKQSTLKKKNEDVVVAESSSSSTKMMANLSRTGSYTSLTAINQSILSRRNSTASEDQQPEFKGFVLKKTGSKPGSRAGSPTKKIDFRHDSTDEISLKKKESSTSRSASRRGSATAETTTEFSNVTLKKSQIVKGDHSKFEVEQVNLKPISVGEEEEASSSLRIREEARASPDTHQRVFRETKFEGGDDEYLNIKSLLDKLKKKELSASSEDLAAKATEVENAAPTEEDTAAKPKVVKDASPAEADAAAKPILYRRRGKLSDEAEAAEKIYLKPVVKTDKTRSFTSSIECIKKAVDDDDEANNRARLSRSSSSNLRKMSFTSSLDNIAIADQKPHEKVHLSCFSKEVGSDVDLVRVCQDQGEGKHEVKLEFEIEGRDVKGRDLEDEEEEEMEEVEEVVEVVKKTVGVVVDDETSERLKAEKKDKIEQSEVENDEVKRHKLRKAPSIDGLFQRQDVQAAFTFTLPFQNEEPNTKLSLEIPNLS